jgi:threonine dehydratase
MPGSDVTLDDVRRAREVLAGHLVDTPFLPSRTLSQISGARVWVKFENLQFTASFKERGALVKLSSLDAGERARGVVAVSAGNHAQAVAYHASRLGIPATIVMPRFTPETKVSRTRVFGAEVVLAGDDFEGARAAAEEIERTRGLARVHPYDDPLIIAGQGTLALEMLDAVPDLDVLVLPIGGGGLAAGCALAAKAVRPDLEVVGVQAARYAAMVRLLTGSGPEPGGSTIAEGIAVKTPGALTAPIVQRCVDHLLLVDESDLEQALLLLLEIEKTVAEGAGAAALAAVLRHPERFRGKRVAVPITGGNVDLMLLSSVIQRGLVRSGRLVRMRLELPDVPGALGAVSALLGRVGANIVEVVHQRAFGASSARAVEAQFVLELRGEQHLAELVQALGAAGYQAHVGELRS